MAGRTQWSDRIYDYELGLILDDEATAVDLDHGLWVHCRRCDLQIHTKTPFKLTRWAAHKQTRAHRDDEIAHPSNEQRGTAQYTEGTDVRRPKTAKDCLVSIRPGADERANEDARAKDLIQKTAMLVSEQQGDIDALREEIEELKDVIHDLRRSHVPGGCSSRHHFRTRHNTNYRLLKDECKRRHFPCACNGSNQESPTTSEAEIDMFDDEVHLMQVN